MTHLSLFSGIGGLDLAAEWAGFQTVGQCEWADYPTKVLEKHWPDVPRWRDIRDLTADDFRRRTGVDRPTVISGGFPCQPHSLAGERKASTDERDLWPQMRRVISDVKPRWVVAENVPGLFSTDDGRFFRAILRDLSEMGFDVGWATYPAAWVGAVHRRERMAIVAHANSIRRGGRGRQEAANKYRKSDGKLGEYGGFEAAFDIVRCLSNPATAPCYLRGNYGLSDWSHRVRGLGNAVVPQQFYPIFRAIAEIEGGHDDQS